MKDKASTFKQLSILWKRMRKRNRQTVVLQWCSAWCEAAMLDDSGNRRSAFPSLGASFVSVVVAFSFFDPSISPGDWTVPLTVFLCQCLKNRVTWRWRWNATGEMSFHFPLFTAPRVLWFAFQPSVIAFEFSKWFIFSLSIWGWFEIADLSGVEMYLLKTYSFQMSPFLWSLLQFSWTEGSLPFYSFIVLLVSQL